MEREFLGFSSKNGAWLTVKEEATDKQKDPVRSSGMQWPVSNKVPALPQFLSFKTTQEDRPRSKDPLASSGYMTITTKDSFDSNQKSFLPVPQKNLSIDMQTGNKHGMNIYAQQCSDAQELRIFSLSNQSNQVNHAVQSSLATTGLKMVNLVTKPQPHVSKSSGTPVSVLPSMGSIVGSTDLRNCSKSNGTPAQLTIFYGGSVRVYDDISLEKAQAIMLLAGNGNSPIQNMASTPNLQPEISFPSKKDGFNISQPYPPSLPSPLPMTSHANPGGGLGSNKELSMTKSVGPSTTPTNHLESSIVAHSVGSSATKRILPVGLPQARKASLVRFLEKRKERVMVTSPYYICKKSPECSTTGSDSVGFSMDFSVSCSLPATN